LEEEHVLWYVGEEFGNEEGVGNRRGETETEDACEDVDVGFPGCDAGSCFSHIQFDDAGGLCLVEDDFALEDFI
jgi:hypothetical protein